MTKIHLQIFGFFLFLVTLCQAEQTTIVKTTDSSASDFKYRIYTLDSNQNLLRVLLPEDEPDSYRCLYKHSDTVFDVSVTMGHVVIGKLFKYSDHSLMWSDDREFADTTIYDNAQLLLDPSPRRFYELALVEPGVITRELHTNSSFKYKLVSQARAEPVKAFVSMGEMTRNLTASVDLPPNCILSQDQLRFYLDQINALMKPVQLWAIRPPAHLELAFLDSNPSRSRADLMRVIRAKAPHLRFLLQSFPNAHEGVWKFLVDIAPQGTVQQISLLESSSGNSRLDRLALQEIHTWNFGVSERGLRFELPLRFTY